MPGPASYKETLRKRLTPRERKETVYGFDLLGDMALIEIPHSLQKKKKLISRTFLDTHPGVTRVYEKVGHHSGKYRIEKTRWLAGKRDPVASYREWSCTYSLDPGKTYEFVTTANRNGKTLWVPLAMPPNAPR